MSIGDEIKKQKMEALKKAQEDRMAAFKAGGPAGMNPSGALNTGPAGAAQGTPQAEPAPWAG